jgi:hypothetical protein
MPRLVNAITPAVVAGAVLVGFSSARAAEPTTQPTQAAAPTTQPTDDVAALKAQVESLENKVSTLETNQDQTQADMTASIQQVLEDADRHSQSLDENGGGAGFDPSKGLYLQSDDGNFYIHPGFILQFRGALDYRDHGKAIGSADDTTGFEIRRAKFEFDGYMGSPDLTYKLQ